MGDDLFGQDLLSLLLPLLLLTLFFLKRCFILDSSMNQELGPLILPPQNCFSCSLSFKDSYDKGIQMPRCFGWELSCLAEVDFAYLGSKLMAKFACGMARLPGNKGSDANSLLKWQRDPPPYRPHSPKVLLFFPWRMRTEAFSSHKHASPEATERPTFLQSSLSACRIYHN